MEAAEKALTQASHTLAQVMYASADPGAAAGQEPKGGPAADGDVIDAEYVEEKKG
jgi:hypothetical protein